MSRDTTHADVIRRVTAKLDAAGIPYMVTGSVISGTYGEPRSTNDVDIVIRPTGQTLAAFVAAFDPHDYYVSKEAADDALTHRSMFNIIDMTTGYKVDLIIAKSRDYDNEAFARRTACDIQGLAAMAVTPEDSILSKLEWHLMSESQRQYRDAVGVAVNQWDRLDVVYLRRWAAEIGVADVLERVLKDADEMRPKI
jgi:hypothetical protein